jgi:primase-polymerase (primpol)-like protein
MLPRGRLVALDLDGCVAKDRSIKPEVQKIVDDLSRYTEVSPSGTGLRIIFRGNAPNRKNLGAGIEIFHSTGFVTITGDVIRSANISAIPEDSLRTIVQRRQYRPAASAGAALEPRSLLTPGDDLPSTTSSATSNGENGPPAQEVPLTFQDFCSSRHKARIEDALSSIPSRDYNTWIQVGLALPVFYT